MDLFSSETPATRNLLPRDGAVYYYGRILPKPEADHFLAGLLERVDWKQDEALIMGKLLKTRRKVAWYGDREFSYTYSRVTKTALPWIPELLSLKEKVEALTGENFNSCLLNLYHNGEEGMAWHSDGEKDLKPGGAIASLSLGAARRFAFKHKESGEKVALVLEHGSLLVMTGSTQTHWLHRLPPVKGIPHPRVNLTFRTIVRQG